MAAEWSLCSTPARDTTGTAGLTGPALQPSVLSASWWSIPQPKDGTGRPGRAAGAWGCVSVAVRPGSWPQH